MVEDAEAKDDLQSFYKEVCSKPQNSCSRTIERDCGETQLTTNEEDFTLLATGQLTEGIQEQRKRKEETMRDQSRIFDKEWALATEEENPNLTTPTFTTILLMT